LQGSQGIQFAGQSRPEVYAWVERTLVGQEYGCQSRRDKGIFRVYLSKVTGLSRAQITRLIGGYLQTGQVIGAQYRRYRFVSKYTEADRVLLAEVDRAHERLSGPATRCIFNREYREFGKQEFERLAEISVAHLYNLRKSARYRKHAGVFDSTRPSAVSIGDRRKPEPQGRPGFLRIDTVHQGESATLQRDWDGAKGVYHINAVDAVTQWQIVGCAERISEQFLIPVLEAILHQFPFWVLGMHADGSEFINHTVARLLEKLWIEFTKSRANRTTDNALVEGKNGAVIRKHIGYGHIAGEHAEPLQKFYTAHLNPYLNYHRPCGFATVSLDARGKRKRQYKSEDYATPYEKLKSLPEAAQHLKAGLRFVQLDKIARAMSDTEAARKMGAAKAKLLRQCKSESPLPPRFG
jgi:hypothetical protein